MLLSEVILSSAQSSKKAIAVGLVHDVPIYFQEALLSHPKTLAAWEDITPLARNEWICWVESAKKTETKHLRLKRMCHELVEGKRRPCCWPGCPHR